MWKCLDIVYMLSSVGRTDHWTGGATAAGTEVEEMTTLQGSAAIEAQVARILQTDTAQTDTDTNTTNTSTTDTVVAMVTVTMTTADMTPVKMTTVTIVIMTTIRVTNLTGPLGRPMKKTV